MVESNVVNVAEALNNATQQQNEEDELTTEDVQDIAETFRNIVDVESVTPEVGQDGYEQKHKIRYKNRNVQ